MIHRTLHYTMTAYCSDGSVSGPHQQEFTLAQATTAGAVLEKDGLMLRSAIALCDQWTSRGCYPDRQYIYRIPLVPEGAHGPVLARALERVAAWLPQ